MKIFTQQGSDDALRKNVKKMPGHSLQVNESVEERGDKLRS